MLAPVAGAVVSIPATATEPDVHDMGGDDGDHPGDEEHDLMIVEHLFKYEHQYAECKYQDGSPGMMVFFEAVGQ